MIEVVPPPGGERTDGEPAPSSARLVWLQRGWLALSQLVLVLPFVVTTDCNGKSEAFTGLGYYFAQDRWPFTLLLLVLLGVLVARPWRGNRDAAGVVGVGLRAFVAALGALLTAFGPLVAFIFASPSPRVGWYLHGGAWTLTALAYTGAAAALTRALPAGAPNVHPRERWGVVALLVAPAAAGLCALALHGEDVVYDAILGVPMGYFVSLPLAIAGVALVRARRAGLRVPFKRAAWWLAAGLVVAASVGAGLGK